MRNKTTVKEQQQNKGAKTDGNAKRGSRQCQQNKTKGVLKLDEHMDA